MLNVKCQMSKCQNVKMSKCQNVKMSKCQMSNIKCQTSNVKRLMSNVKRLTSNVQMFKCSNVQMFKCSNICSNVQTFKRSNVRTFNVNVMSDHVRSNHACLHSKPALLDHVCGCVACLFELLSDCLANVLRQLSQHSCRQRSTIRFKSFDHFISLFSI